MHDIEELRNQIKDYYGTAIQKYPAAMEEFILLEQMTDNEIIKKAKAGSRKMYETIVSCFN